MAYSGYRRAIGTFPSQRDAELALHELRAAGFNMDKVSVIAENGSRNEQLVEGKKAGEQAKGGAKAGATAGAATGGIIGLVGSLGVLALPGVGAAAEVGILLANTVIGGGIGAAGGGLVGALIGWGIPGDRAKYYDERLQAGEYVLLVEGTEAEVRSAEAILASRGIQDWEIYHAPSESGGAM